METKSTTIPTPATEKQIAYLEKLGTDFINWSERHDEALKASRLADFKRALSDARCTKRNASKAIDALKRESEMQRGRYRGASGFTSDSTIMSVFDDVYKALGEIGVKWAEDEYNADWC